MCGIVGYTGKAQALSPVLEGLRRLEYRGYDSAGIALVVTPGAPLWIEKRAGKLANLEETLGTNKPDAHSGIGHTRWATHGGPTDTNAHPHLDNEGKLALIHNGIIENYVELRAELEKRGHVFKSETDTESVVHLLSDARKAHNGDLAAAMREVCSQLRGSFTLLAIHADEPGRIVGARRNSPLVVGVGQGENFLASDVSAFIAYTKHALELGQDEVVDITPSSSQLMKKMSTSLLRPTRHLLLIATSLKSAYSYVAAAEKLNTSLLMKLITWMFLHARWFLLQQQ